MSKHRETLTFNGFSGYYGPVPDGYGGLDWNDIEYLSMHDEPGSSDQGFHQAIKGHGEACLGPSESGFFESANTSATFSLKSMLAESGSSTGDPVLFVSYTYSHGALVPKAEDFVYVTSQVQKIDFATLGGKGDFQNIVAVSMRVGSAAYGPHYAHETIGNGLVFDNLRLEWKSKAAEQSNASHALPHVHAALTGHSSADLPGEGSAESSTQVGFFTGDHQGLAHPNIASGHLSLLPEGSTNHFVPLEPEHFGP